MWQRISQDKKDVGSDDSGDEAGCEEHRKRLRG